MRLFWRCFKVEWKVLMFLRRFLKTKVFKKNWIKLILKFHLKYLIFLAVCHPKVWKVICFQLIWIFLSWSKPLKLTVYRTQKPTSFIWLRTKKVPINFLRKDKKNWRKWIHFLYKTWYIQRTNVSKFIMLLDALE